MKKASKETIKFLKNNVKELNSFLPLNDDRRYDLLVFVENMFVVPLANAASENAKIDEHLLNEAENVIDYLNEEDLDFEDFNKKIMWQLIKNKFLLNKFGNLKVPNFFVFSKNANFHILRPNSH